MDLIMDRAEIMKNLNLKQQVEVEFTATKKKGEKSIFDLEGSLNSISGDSLEFTVPATYRSWSPLLRAGRVVTVNFGRSNALYTFKSKIISKEVLTDFKLFLEIPKVIAKKERRQDKRIPISSPVNFKVREYANANIAHLSDKIGRGFCRDIGTGGMNFVTPLKLPVGLIAEIEFELLNSQISLLGKVSRVHKDDHNNNGDYSIGIKFMEVDTGVAEKIKQFIFGMSHRFNGGISI